MQAPVSLLLQGILEEESWHLSLEDAFQLMLWPQKAANDIDPIINKFILYIVCW